MKANSRQRALLLASQRLAYYAVFIAVMGIIGFLTNPAKAKSALISGLVSGGLCLVWSYLISNGSSNTSKWGCIAGFVSCLVLGFVFAWRAFLAWNSYLSGQEEKLVPAVLTSVMSLASAVTLPSLAYF
eukprot:TRINITY_DN1423_c0_g1_i1.p1 TRINITY_DN1423_c0_g1~~TRINITY_DN1423_c0_g1_i1.p1  ORF type:complete len:129 (+),score=6.94 TRINITY_DN1423_c0_g1_i1:39-425(+)